MKYLVFLILICMLFFIKNAATSLLIYGFFAADRDGYSFLEFFSTLYPNFKLYSRSLFFVLFVYSIIYLFLKIRKLTKEEFVKIFLALIISFLIVFNSLLKDNDIIWALSVLVFNGIPVYVIWYIMGLRYNNDYKFLGYISLKTILATAVLLIPFLAFLDGSLYKATEGLFVNEVSDVNLSLPTGDSIKGAYSRYSIYHNPNSLGFHSVIGILIGIYFLVFKKKILKIFGLFLIGCGCIGWLNSLTRGPMIFLILGFCYIALLNIFYGKRQNFEIKILLLLSLLGVGLAIFLLSDISKYLIPDSNDNSVVDRLEGYLYSFDVIKTHFLLGVGKNWDWGQFYPHFMPLSLTADHGIIVGVLESISIFMGGIYTIIKASRNYLTISSNREDSLLSIMLVFIVIGIAVTNNFTAPVIFWIMLAQADLLNKRVING
ncbi:O-antigen ligase family protein [Acinetobacter pittii]|uniref:O-antigen ligase family protein n=1 Tax=Acinetobacter pittii TaxID=48296 RepID=UPI001980036C|nr:O-antigen ligase family protein [Acinetobacter pittii]MBN6515106.1 hypothetical protein [Acinetobacter pittii]